MSFLAKFEEDLTFARWAQDNGRHEDGLAVTQNYVGPASRSCDFLLAHALLLQGLAKFEEADVYLERVLELDPRNINAISHRIYCLRSTGKNKLAAELIRRARPQHPDHGGLFADYLCEVMSESGAKAAIDLIAAEHRSPNRCRNIDTAIEIFRQKLLSLHDPDEVRGLDPNNLLGLAASGGSGTYKLREIYEQFESLGANCDFGFVQRKRGAEPLSLLRWTSVTPQNLARLLAADLAHYDDPSCYSLRGAHEREYILYENVYETQGHTGVNSSDIPHDEFFDRLTRRQAFLKRKFLAELTAGKKIFLYMAKDQISEEEMESIERELRRLGARHCMFTMLTDDKAQAGTLAFPTPKRAVGYLSRKRFTDTMDEWDRIIVAAYDRFLLNELAA
jgi:tetratricopeptide (TPR) repeat protein